MRKQIRNIFVTFCTASALACVGSSSSAQTIEVTERYLIERLQETLDFENLKVTSPNRCMLKVEGVFSVAPGEDNGFAGMIKETSLMDLRKAKFAIVTDGFQIESETHFASYRWDILGSPTLTNTNGPSGCPLFFDVCLNQEHEEKAFGFFLDTNSEIERRMVKALSHYANLCGATDPFVEDE